MDLLPSWVHESLRESTWMKSLSLIPAKGRVKAPPVVSIEMLEAGYSGTVMSFDGAAKMSTRKGSCGCILWKLPE
jgi:hypothetical protein